MKVIIVSPCILPVPAVKGGAVLTLIESLAEQNEKQNKLDLTIVGSYDPASEKIAAGYSNTNFIFLKQHRAIRHLDCMIDKIWGTVNGNVRNSHYIWKLCVIGKVIEVLLENSYDRVVFQNSGFLLNVLRNKKVQKKYQGKVYFHIHNDIPDNIYVEGLKQCKLLLISSYLKNKIVKICGEKFESQIAVVKNGFDSLLFTKDLSDTEKDAIKIKLGISPEKKVILFTGRIVPEKGIEQLVQAFVKLEREDTILLVIGSHNFGGKETSAFEKKMTQLFTELNHNVVFTGYVPYKEIWKYYKIADLAVLPSLWEEPAGLTMIEASAAAVPLITTYAGGIPEYLSESHVVFINRDENIVDNILAAMEEFFVNTNCWKKRACSASSFVEENYSLERFYSCFVECLAE